MSTRPSRRTAVLVAGTTLLLAGGLWYAVRELSGPGSREVSGGDGPGGGATSGLAPSPASRKAGPRDSEDVAFEDADPTLASLIRRLRSPEISVRADALIRLRTLGPRAAPAAPRILDILKEGDPRLDGLVAVALAALGPDAIEAVETALASGDVRVRAGAMSSLSRITCLTARGLLALRQGLHDPDDSVRAAAAIAWAGHREDASGDALAGLLARLEDSSPRVRAAAACTLGKLGVEPRATVTAIERLAALPGEVDAVRLEAVWALVRLGTLGAGGSTTLADAAVDGSPDVRREALRGLMILGPLAGAAAPRALEEVGRLDGEERAAWVRVLAVIAPEREDVTAVLWESLRTGDGTAGAAVEGLVGAGEPGVAALRGAVADATAREVLDAATVGGAAGDRGRVTRACLERLVSDPSEVLSELALRSLAAAGEEAVDSIGVVVAAMEQAPSSRWASFARTLGEIGGGSPAAAGALLEAAKRGDETTRVAAIQGLGYIGVSTIEVEAHLNAAASSADLATSREARRALRRLDGTQARAASAVGNAPRERAAESSDR